tara:strand:- start:2427 stop:2657 length:231 start_codon:yes stop_codon:yes gene_type:complete
MRHGKDRTYSATGGRKARRERALERLKASKFTPKTMSNGKERNEKNWTEKKETQIATLETRIQTSETKGYVSREAH